MQKLFLNLKVPVVAQSQNQSCWFSIVAPNSEIESKVLKDYPSFARISGKSHNQANDFVAKYRFEGSVKLSARVIQFYLSYRVLEYY